MKKEDIEAIQAASERGRRATSQEMKEAAHRDFWSLAVKCWNDQIAGDIEFDDGTILETPGFEYKD